MKLLTVLVGNDGTSCGTCVSGQGNSTLRTVKQWSESHQKTEGLSLTRQLGVKRQILTFLTYVEDDTADRGSSLGVAGLVGGVRLGLECRVTEAIVIVKSAKGHLVEVCELLSHLFDFYLFLINFD